MTLACMAPVDVIVSVGGTPVPIALIVWTVSLGQSVLNALKTAVMEYVRVGKTVQDNVFAMTDGISMRHHRAQHVCMGILVHSANCVQVFLKAICLAMVKEIVTF